MKPLTVYKASAGSGKTFTLAVEYMKLLVLAREGGEYAHILAVTFTNKATSEMKNRIISQLYGIAHDLPSSRPYLEALRRSLHGEPDAPDTDHEIRRRCALALHQLLHDYNRFRVETIDSFFQTVLRGLAHELGLTANLQVEINDAEVLSEAVDRIVDRLQDEPVVLDWLLSLVRDQIENNQRWDVTRRVKDFGRAIFNEDYLRRGDQLRELLRQGDVVRRLMQTLREREQDAVAVVKGYGKQLEELFASSGLSYGDFSNGQRLLAGLVQKLLAGDLAEIEVSATLLRWADDPLAMVKKADQTGRPDLVDAADAISGIIGELVANLPDLQYTVNSSRQALAHVKPLFLLDFIDHEVAEINAETSRFNLAKTPILLSRMVGESDAPFVFEKIGAQLHHVMIDEFQDTSRLQWENFRALLLESFSRGGRNLLVGDVKQSIYRWRGGDWRTLGHIEQLVQPTPDVRTLDTNYRSLRRIVEFNNSFFEAASQALEAVSEGEERLLEQPDFFASAYADVRQKVPTGKGEEGYVRVRVLDGQELRRREEWEPEVLDDLRGCILDLHAAGVPFDQMAILVRNNFECEAIVQAFAEAGDMPAIISDEAFLLASCLPVTLLIEALRLLQEPQATLPRFYLEEHGVDVGRVLAGREAYLQTPLYELLERLYQDLNLQTFAGQDAYLFGFFDAVGDYLHGEAADLAAFLRYWDERLSRQSIPAGEVDGIRILTIHKSKGLEFHTVLMPFCTWDFERDRPSSLIWCTPTEAPYSDFQLLPVTPSAKVTPNSVFARDYAETHLLSRMDELNTLYVGSTRARANLYIWSVGSDLDRDGRTVGDLVACVMSGLAEAVDGVYTIGEPVLTAGQKGGEEDNRMALSPDALPVRMQSFDLNVTFRQSNQSAQFIAAESDAEHPSPEEQAQKMYLETGRLLHRVLQSIRVEEDVPGVLDRFEREGLISRYTAEGQQVAVPRADMERWVMQGLRNPLVQDWFQPHWQLFNECSIVSLRADGQPEVHRPDRVMVSADGRRVVVVDFKFGAMRPSYEAQVLGYMQLMGRMMPSAAVEGYLWFVYSGKVHRVGDGSSRSSGLSAADASQLTLDFFVQ